MRLTSTCLKMGFVLTICVLSACGQEAAAPAAVGAAHDLPAGELRRGGLFSEENRFTPALLTTLREFAEPGLVVHEVEFADETALVVLELATNRFTPTLLVADTSNGRGISARDALAQPGMAVVIGSGFVSELRSLSPVGLLQKEGRQISELQRHGYTRILGIREGTLGVVASREFHRGMFDSAIQVGPGIVEHGQLDISTADLNRQKYFRTFVATCVDRTLVGASSIPMHLYHVGEQFLAFATKIGAQCDEMVNLAGDREAILAMGAADRIGYLGHPETGKAALLGFRRRR
jgi:hypothetical protein